MAGQAFGLTAHAWAKCDAALRAVLRTGGGDTNMPVPVVIVLAGRQPPSGGSTGAVGGRPSRAERGRAARAAEAAFEAEVRKLVEVIVSVGATQVQQSWLARTIGARVTLPAIEAAAADPLTTRIILAGLQQVTV